jgi:hypothetical protein
MRIASRVRYNVSEAAGRTRRIAACADRRVKHVAAALKLNRLRASGTQAGHAHSNPKGGNRPSIQYHAEIPPLLAQNAERMGMLTPIRSIASEKFC